MHRNGHLAIAIILVTLGLLVFALSVAAQTPAPAPMPPLPQLTNARLMQIIGEQQATITMQGEYITALQRRIVEMQEEAKKPE